MYEWMRDFHRIYVTGPQRSGTTICARIIAHDTGYRYVDEEEFGVHEYADLIRLVQETDESLVVQCPGISRWIHAGELGGDPRSAVVWMLRPLHEIVASQQRIGWAKEADERAKYDDVNLSSLPGPEEPVAKLKYAFWRQFQLARIAHPHEIGYYGLSWHPLWVPKGQRHGFAPRQWQLEGQHA